MDFDAGPVQSISIKKPVFKHLHFLDAMQAWSEET